MLTPNLPQIVDGKIKISPGGASSFQPLEEVVTSVSQQQASTSSQQKRKAAEPASNEPLPKQPNLPAPAIFSDEPDTKVSV